MPGDLERAETAAFCDLFAAVPPLLKQRHGFDITEIGGATCGVLASLPSSREFNRVMACGLHSAAGDEVLDEIERWYAGAPFVVALSPEAEPADLASRLAARGFTPDYAWMKFARTPDAEVTAPTDLRVERIDGEHADDFASVVASAFEMPAFLCQVLRLLPGRDRWSCWAAFADDRAVGAGALFVDGDSAWASFGATIPEARGRGAQSAILAARVRAAAEAGCRTITTETGVRVPGRPARSYRNLLRAGFDEVYERPNWRSPEALAAA